MVHFSLLNIQKLCYAAANELNQCPFDYFLSWINLDPDFDYVSTETSKSVAEHYKLLQQLGGNVIWQYFIDVPSILVQCVDSK